MEALQDTTKIQKRYLKAIEDNQFEVLPGKFYTRAFIREYASAVGLDPEMIMEEHKNELPTFDEEPTIQYSRVQKARNEATQKSSRSFKFLPTFLTVALIVAVAFVVWIVIQSVGGTSDDTAEDGQGSDNEISVPADSEQEDEETPEEEPQEEGETPQDEEQPAEDDSEAEEPALNAELTQEGTGGFPEHVYSISGAEDRSVTIELEGTAYLEVQSPKGGENLITPKEYTTGESPLSLEFDGQNELYIKTGNAPGTVVKIGDEVIEFPDPEKSTQKMLLQYQE